MSTTASVFFEKLASAQAARNSDARLQFLQRMKQLQSRLGAKEAHVLGDDDSTNTIAIKTAANLLSLLKLLKSSEGSHLIGSALYAPLVASDAMEAMKQRRQGRSGLMPALASGALAVMMAQHAAPLAEKAINRFQPGQKVRSLLSSFGTK